MELRHLRYFITVAEELSFTKAAKKLGISQPPLSRQIKELEQNIKACLFYRNNKRVILTEAGKYFEHEVRHILQALKTTSRRAQKISENISGNFQIGYVSSTFSPNFSNLIQYLTKKFPYVTIKLFEVATAKQIIALIEEGAVDLGIHRASLRGPKIKSTLWFRDNFSIVYNKDLHNVESDADMEKLMSETFIFFNQEYAPYYYDALMGICADYGFKPNVVHELNNFGSMIQMVSSGLGISIVPSSLLKSYSLLNIGFFELKNTNASTEVIIASQNNIESEVTHSAIKFLLS